jgi:hypothetical protein
LTASSLARLSEEKRQRVHVYSEEMKQHRA